MTIKTKEIIYIPSSIVWYWCLATCFVCCV